VLSDYTLSSPILQQHTSNATLSYYKTIKVRVLLTPLFWQLGSGNLVIQRQKEEPHLCLGFNV